MADEYPSGICGRKLWDSTKTLFSPAANPSPCSIGDSTFLIDPTFRTASNWYQNFHGDDGQRVDTTLVVDSITGTKLNYDHQETSGSDEQQNPSIFKADHDFEFLMDQPYNQSPCNFYDNVITTTCQGLPTAFPFGTISNGYTPTLLHNSLDQPKQFLANNRTINRCSSTNSDELLSCRPIFETHLLQPPALNFPNSIRPKCPNLTTKLIGCEGVVQDSGRVERKNESNEIAIIKRPRSDMPSTLPTFKVRKEKLGDKITMLQQLVSPFGKTDTASVLHEAIDYIKFLHDQVRVLSTPYMEVGEHDQEQQVKEKPRGTKENKKQDLRSRGLCLVAIPSTVALANGNTLDFWSPTFGGTFR